MTIHLSDISDVYEEKIEGDKYLFKNEWKPLKTKTEIIKVKGGQPISIDIKYTHHGPIMRHVSNEIGKVLY